MIKHWAIYDQWLLFPDTFLRVIRRRVIQLRTIEWFGFLCQEENDLGHTHRASAVRDIPSGTLERIRGLHIRTPRRSGCVAEPNGVDELPVKHRGTILLTPQQPFPKNVALCVQRGRAGCACSSGTDIDTIELLVGGLDFGLGPRPAHKSLLSNR